MAIATFLVRVQGYADITGALSADLVDTYLNRGAAWLIRILPADLFEEFSVATAVPNGGLAIANKRFSNVTVNGYQAMPVNQTRYTQALDVTSIFRATELSPIYTTNAGKVYVAPQGQTSYANVLAIPTIATSDTACATLPTGADTIICEWAALQCLLTQAQDVASSVYTLAITTPGGTIDLSTQYTALATVLDTQEDIELANAKMQEIQVRINEFLAEHQASTTASNLLNGMTQRINDLRAQLMLDLQTYLGIGAKQQ